MARHDRKYVFIALCPLFVCGNIAQAAEQLYTTQKSVSSIVEETGFTSSGYFCRKFRQYYHMSPNEYRKKKTEGLLLSCMNLTYDHLSKFQFILFNPLNKRCFICTVISRIPIKVQCFFFL